MTNTGMAGAYMRQAERALEEAKRHLAAEGWGLAVRRAQEALELGLKSLLRYAGVETPKWHDVGGILLKHRDRFPPQYAKRMEDFARWSAELRSKREPALYGDESRGVGSDELFSMSEAEEAVRWAGEVFSSVREILKRK